MALNKCDSNSIFSNGTDLGFEPFIANSQSLLYNSIQLNSKYFICHWGQLKDYYIKHVKQKRNKSLFSVAPLSFFTQCGLVFP